MDDDDYLDALWPPVGWYASCSHSLVLIAPQLTDTPRATVHVSAERK